MVRIRNDDSSEDEAPPSAARTKHPPAERTSQSQPPAAPVQYDFDMGESSDDEALIPRRPPAVSYSRVAISAGASASDDGVLRLRGAIPGAGPASAEKRQREFVFSSVPGQQMNGRPVFVRKRQGDIQPEDRTLWFEDSVWLSGSKEDFDERLKADERFTVGDPAAEFMFSNWRSEETDVVHPKDVKHWYFSDGQVWTPTTLSSKGEAASQLHRQGSKSAAAGDPPWLVAKALAYASGEHDELYSQLADQNGWDGPEELLSVRFGLWQTGEDRESAWTPLTWLCSVGEVAYAKKLVERGVDLDAPDGEGRTPLMSAASNDQVACLRWLLELGANLDRYADEEALSSLPPASRSIVRGALHQRASGPSGALLQVDAPRESIVYPAQVKVGDEMAKRIIGSYGGDDAFTRRCVLTSLVRAHSGLTALPLLKLSPSPQISFNDVDFLIVTANFNSLRNQTRGRLVDLRPRDAPEGLLKAPEEEYEKAPTCMRVASATLSLSCPIHLSAGRHISQHLPCRRQQPKGCASQRSRGRAGAEGQ